MLTSSTQLKKKVISRRSVGNASKVNQHCEESGFQSNLLQCDAPYRGHPTNIFTSKKLANQGTRI